MLSSFERRQLSQVLHRCLPVIPADLTKLVLSYLEPSCILIEDLIKCIRLMNPRELGSVTNIRDLSPHNLHSVVHELLDRDCRDYNGYPFHIRALQRELSSIPGESGINRWNEMLLSWVDHSQFKYNPLQTLFHSGREFDLRSSLICALIPSLDHCGHGSSLNTATLEQYLLYRSDEVVSVSPLHWLLILGMRHTHSSLTESTSHAIRIIDDEQVQHRHVREKPEDRSIIESELVARMVRLFQDCVLHKVNGDTRLLRRMWDGMCLNRCVIGLTPLHSLFFDRRPPGMAVARLLMPHSMDARQFINDICVNEGGISVWDSARKSDAKEQALRGTGLGWTTLSRVRVLQALVKDSEGPNERD